MQEFLRNYLLDKIEDEKYYTFDYKEDVNKDALTNDWLENRTSYIYKVGVLTAIDSNKCDFIHVVIGTQVTNDILTNYNGYKCVDDIKNSFTKETFDNNINLPKKYYWQHVCE